MATQAFSRGTKLLKGGIKNLLKSDEIKNTLMEVADEIVRDVKTMSGSDEYHAEIWNKRKTRAVVNIISDGEDAMRIEAEHGHLARAAGKQRGEV
jgi:coproporphyrinogen III oxidase